MRSIVTAGKYSVVICKDPHHNCYGTPVQIGEGYWLGHFLRVEKISYNEFNVQVDKKIRLGLNYKRMERFILAEVL